MKQLNTHNSQTTHTHTSKSRVPRNIASIYVLLSIFLMLIFAGCSEMKLLGVERDEDLKLFTEAEIALMKYTDMDFTYIQPEAFKQASDIAKAFDEIDGKKRIVKPPIIINLPRQKQDYIKLDSTPEIYIYNFEPYLGKSLLQIQTENISVCYTT